MGSLKLTALHIALASIAAIVPAMFVFDIVALYTTVGSVLITTSIAVAHAYWPSANIALQVSARDLKPVDILSIAFVLLFFFTAAREGYITVWRTYFPVTTPRSPDYFAPLIVFRYWLLVAAIMVLHARPAVLGPQFMQKVPGWPRIFLALVSGMGLAVLLLNT